MAVPDEDNQQEAAILRHVLAAPGDDAHESRVDSGMTEMNKCLLQIGTSLLKWSVLMKAAPLHGGAAGESAALGLLSKGQRGQNGADLHIITSLQKSGLPRTIGERATKWKPQMTDKLF